MLAASPCGCFGIVKTLLTLIMKLPMIAFVISPRCGQQSTNLENEPFFICRKVNPTQIEAITMVCAQVMGNVQPLPLADAETFLD